jgi:triacylglycerol lipase
MSWRVRPLQRVLCHSRRYVSREADAAENVLDEREKELGRLLKDDFASIRAKYATPKNPIVLAHGLFGFDELHLFGKHLAGLQYWRGIREALRKNNIEVITTSVTPSGSIEARAAELAAQIATKANGRKVNIIAHSMGGLDARYMISQLKPKNLTVLSLTTIATPHRGSAFADFVFDRIGAKHVPLAYKLLETIGMETGAFSQLTRKYMSETFNPKTPDLPDVRYYSYGASLEPRIWTTFRISHNIIKRMEGAANDGLVR